MAASQAGAAQTEPTEQRSMLGRVTVTLVVLSAIGLVLLIIGSIASWKGFSEDEDDVSTFADVVWSTFAIAGLLALVLGIVAWVRGRGGRAPGDVRAGQMAVGWIVFAIALSAIWTALD